MYDFKLYIVPAKYTNKWKIIRLNMMLLNHCTLRVTDQSINWDTACGMAFMNYTIAELIIINLPIYQSNLIVKHS